MHILSCIITKQGKLCKGLGSSWNLQTTNTVQDKDKPHELHLVKQGTMKGLLRSKQADQSSENNSGGCTVCHSKVSLEGNLGTLSGERTGLQGFPQSPPSQIPCDRCHGTQWKSPVVQRQGAGTGSLLTQTSLEF